MVRKLVLVVNLVLVLISYSKSDLKAAIVRLELRLLLVLCCEDFAQGFSLFTNSQNQHFEFQPIKGASVFVEKTPRIPPQSDKVVLIVTMYFSMMKAIINI